ncbi:MAG: 2-amino-4-hydroxy-6-hydroxymethyldihydropteridine diphosphokinase [Actinomycetota bacterium]|nr:2-amino-4-hydroxy-6-hydroxymethyldihydropteridine diphosphokinase [Actinomycetota bacterium]
MKALLSIGSNLGEPIENCRRALEMLGEKIVASSSLYETSPVETIDAQRAYVNVSVLIETSDSPLQLLERIQSIESYFDRQRPHFHAARTMDIDIIWLEGIELTGGRLTVPHPRASMRLFVLLPTFEISPDLAVKLADPEATPYLGSLEVGKSLVATLGTEIQEITLIEGPAK